MSGGGMSSEGVRTNDDGLLSFEVYREREDEALDSNGKGKEERGVMGLSRIL